LRLIDLSGLFVAPTRGALRLIAQAAGALLAGASVARATESAGVAGDSGDLTMLLLAGALAVSIGAAAVLYVANSKARAAQASLAAFTTQLDGDPASEWRPTGVANIDAVARHLEENKRRLQEKRVRIAADQDEIQAAREHGRVMDLELHHRVNNAMAMIQGVANITARTARDFDCFRDSFNERVQCLSRISTLLVRKSWARTPLRELIHTVLDRQSTDRIVLDGPDIDLRSEVALALGMALHELLSNAERHGALSTDNGVVNIDWRRDPSSDLQLALVWTERGGPGIEEPQPNGAGHYLVRNVLARQFGGDAELAFDQEGLRVTLTAQI
jgi:two-component sensor histidine kinase